MQEKGGYVCNDYRLQKWLSSFTPLCVPTLGWGLCYTMWLATPFFKMWSLVHQSLTLAGSMTCTVQLKWQKQCGATSKLRPQKPICFCSYFGSLASAIWTNLRLISKRQREREKDHPRWVPDVWDSPAMIGKADTQLTTHRNKPSGDQKSIVLSHKNITHFHLVLLECSCLTRPPYCEEAQRAMINQLMSRRTKTSSPQLHSAPASPCEWAPFKVDLLAPSWTSSTDTLWNKVKSSSPKSAQIPVHARMLLIMFLPTLNKKFQENKYICLCYSLQYPLSLE